MKARKLTSILMAAIILLNLGFITDTAPTTNAAATKAIELNKEYTGVVIDRLAGSSENQSYTFKVNAGGRLEMVYQVTDAVDTPDLELKLVGGGHTYLTHSTTNFKEQSIGAFVDGGDYTLTFSEGPINGLNDETHFKFTVQFTQYDTYPETFDNDNNSEENAFLIDPSNDLICSLTDNDPFDYYYFTLDNDSVLNIKFESGYGDRTTVEISIYDKFNDISYKESIYGNRSSNFVLKKNTYYMKVQRGAQFGGYTLRLNLGGLESTAISKLKKAGSNTIKVSWVRSTEVAGYQVQYSLNSNFKKKGIKDVSGYQEKSTTIYATNFKKGKRVYVRVRPYYISSGSEPVYGNFGAVMSIKL